MTHISLPDLAVDSLTESEITTIQAALLLTEFSKKIDSILLRMQEHHIDSMRIILRTPSESLIEWRAKKDQILFFVERVLRIR